MPSCFRLAGQTAAQRRQISLSTGPLNGIGSKVDLGRRPQPLRPRSQSMVGEGGSFGTLVKQTDRGGLGRLKRPFKPSIEQFPWLHAVPHASKRSSTATLETGADVEILDAQGGRELLQK